MNRDTIFYYQKYCGRDRQSGPLVYYCFVPLFCFASFYGDRVSSYNFHLWHRKMKVINLQTV